MEGGVLVFDKQSQMVLGGWNRIGDYWPPAALPGASATLACAISIAQPADSACNAPEAFLPVPEAFLPVHSIYYL